MSDQPKTYCGDGVYAIWDGYGVWLYANDHENPTDKVYLEPRVLESVLRFFNQCSLKPLEKQ